MSLKKSMIVFSLFTLLGSACGSLDPAEAGTAEEVAPLSAAGSACSSLAVADFDEVLTLIDAALAAAASDVAACDAAPDQCTDRGRTTYERSLLESARNGMADSRRAFVEAFTTAPSNAAWYVQSATIDVLGSLQSAAVTATLSATRNANPTAARALHEHASVAHELAADLRARAGRCYMGIP